MKKQLCFFLCIGFILSLSVYANDAVLPEFQKTLKQSRISATEFASFNPMGIHSVSADSFKPVSRFTTADGKVTIRLQKSYKGIAIIGSILAVNYAQGMSSVTNVDGFDFKVDTNLVTVPSIDLEECVKDAKEELAHLRGLRIHSSKLNILCDDEGSHLVWNVVLTNNLNRKWKLVVDAHDGQVRACFTLIQTFHGDVNLLSDGQAQGPNVSFQCKQDGNGFRLSSTVQGTDVRTYNVRNGENTQKGGEDRSSTSSWEDAVTATAHFYTEQVSEFYKELFNRNSLDNNNMPLISRVHMPDPNSGSTKFDNAFWDGERMSYGDGSWDGNDGMFTPLCVADVVSHELSHGVTTNTSNLEYWYQSGAMNESFSDIMAAAFEYWLNSKINNPAMEWQKVGEECVPPGSKIGRDALRYIDDPTKSRQPKELQGEFWLEWWEALQDNGGVHTNSGVGNHAYYLMSVGGTQNGVTVNPIGVLLAAKVIYYSNAKYLTNQSEYADWPGACLKALENDITESDIQQYGVTSSREDIAKSISDAWQAVKVSATDSNVSFMAAASTANTKHLEEKDSFSMSRFLHEGSTVTISATFSGQDVDLYVYNKNGCKVATAKKQKQQESITFTAKKSGTYTIEAHAFSGAGQVTIDVN